MSGISYNTLVTNIRSYTEVDANVFTTDVLESFILNAQQRIMMDLPMDSDRFVDQGTMATDVNNIRVPAGCLFVRGVEVFNATNSTEQGTWLERRDQTFLSESSVEGEELECASCGNTFSIVSGDPVSDLELPPLKTYDIYEEDGNIYLNL